MVVGEELCVDCGAGQRVVVMLVGQVLVVREAVELAGDVLIDVLVGVPGQGQRVLVQCSPHVRLDAMLGVSYSVIHLLCLDAVLVPDLSGEYHIVSRVITGDLVLADAPHAQLKQLVGPTFGALMPCIAFAHLACQST